MFSGCKEDPNNSDTPGRVENLTATAGDGYVCLEWSIPLYTGGEILGYEITMDNWANKTIKTASDFSHTYTDLINNTKYTFKICALNANGAGEENSVIAMPKEDKPNFTIECGIKKKNEDEYIQMCAVPDRIPINSSFKVIIENHTKEDFCWDLSYILQQFNGISWKKIDLDIFFPSPTYFIKPDENAEQEIHLPNEISTTGKYRIGKVVEVKLNPFRLIYFYAEFEVVENE
jgi:hypothetical protein